MIIIVTKLIFSSNTAKKTPQVSNNFVKNLSSEWKPYLSILKMQIILRVKFNSSVAPGLDFRTT